MAFTADEVATFKTMQSILDFASVDPSVAAAFYLETAAVPHTMPRALGIVPVEEFRSMINEITIAVEGGEPRKLKFAEKGALLLVGEACRVCAGFLGSAPPGSIVAPGAPSAGPAVSAPSVAGRKIKLSLVIRQADETEIDVCDETILDIGQGRWEATFGLESKPDDNEDVTIEQISGVKWLIDNKVVPYLDFAIWGAYGHRMERKLRLSGQVLDSAGKFRHRNCRPSHA